MDNTCFLISDTRILRQQKLQCGSRDISARYILICKKKSHFLVASPNSLNGPARVSSTPELISETVETMIRQSILQALEKQKAKLALEQNKEETNSHNVRSVWIKITKFFKRHVSIIL